MLKKVLIEASYYEIEDLVRKHYPFIKEYELPCIEECRNDTVLTFNIDGVLDDYYNKKWEQIKQTGNPGLYTTRLLLNKMCQDGHIEPGEYLVKVSW